MRIERPKIRVIEDQSEEVNDVNVSKEMEQRLLDKYYADINKNNVAKKVETGNNIRKKEPNPTSTGDIGKSDEYYQKTKYNNINGEQDPFFSVDMKVTIKSDMKFR